MPCQMPYHVLDNVSGLTYSALGLLKGGPDGGLIMSSAPRSIGVDRFVTHSSIADFANDRVNLGRDDVSTSREQVKRMREKLEQYIAEHAGFDLVKMLHSGSVAKGTALKNFEDMDVAVYLEAGQAPQDEKTLHSWLIDRLRL